MPIVGVGIDIAKICRFKKILNEKYLQNFVNKVLHEKEKNEFNSFKDDNKKAVYLASRWSYKEALVKATGDKKIIFSSVYLKKNENGKPFLNFEKENLNFFVSITHEDEYAASVVICEAKI